MIKFRSESWITNSWTLQEKKERLIEEVRDILGFRIDPRDERFKEALEQKEKEEKKKSKAAKKLAKEQRMLEQLRREVDTVEKEGEGKGGGGEREDKDGKSLQGTIIAWENTRKCNTIKGTKGGQKEEYDE